MRLRLGLLALLVALLRLGCAPHRSAVAKATAPTLAGDTHLGFKVVKGICITALEPMSAKECARMAKSLKAQTCPFHERLLQSEPAAPSFFLLMGFRMGRNSVKLTLNEDKRDYTYYRDHGWFDSDYFYPTHLGPLKKAAGAVFDWTARHIFADHGDACA